MNETVLKESFGRIKSDIDELREAVRKLREENEFLREQVRSLSVLPARTIEKPSLEQEVAKKLNRNKKEVIKHKMSELLDQGISVIEVKDRIVDQQRYCAKASFYRYLEELKRENKYIEVVQ